MSKGLRLFNKANEEYHDENFHEAIWLYRKASKTLLGDDLIKCNYNLGTAMLKISEGLGRGGVDNYKEIIELFKYNAIYSSSMEHKADCYHQMSVTYYRMYRYKRKIFTRYYEETSDIREMLRTINLALKYNPSDTHIQKTYKNMKKFVQKLNQE